MKEPWETLQNHLLALSLPTIPAFTGLLGNDTLYNHIDQPWVSVQAVPEPRELIFKPREVPVTEGLIL